jgi:hypothetical protein
MLAIAACAVGDDRAPEPAKRVALMDLPAGHVTECRRFARLRPACPENIPVVDDSHGRARSFRSGRDHVLFFSEWGGPYPGLTPKNAPPRFAHLVVHAGDLDGAFPFAWPTRRAAIRDPIPNKRRTAILLGAVTWSGKQGSVVLAPSFPTGGIDGDHLIFRWTEGGKEYAVTIHAWSPLGAGIDALEAGVASTASRWERPATAGTPACGRLRL